MSAALRVLGVCVIGTALTFLLREMGFRGAKLVSSVTIVVSLGFAAVGIERIISGLDITPFGAEVSRAALLLLKIIGTGYLFGLVSDICRELGEGGIASAMLVVGRVEILLLILPTLGEIIGLGIEYMK